MTAECECFWTPEHMWLSAASCGYGGGYEPGSQQEWNPDCPAHPAADPLTSAVYSEDALTPEEARIIIDAGFDPERILAYLFGEDGDDKPTVCAAHGAFIPCRKNGEHRYTDSPYWVKSVRDYQSSPIEGLTWEPAWPDG